MPQRAIRLGSEEPERRIVLVTDADTNAGRDLVEDLTRNGYTVVGTARHPDRRTWGAAPCYLMDPANERGVRATLSQVRREAGELWGVIHLDTPPTADDEVRALDRSAATATSKVVEVFVVGREAVKAMRKSGVGRIVYVTLGPVVSREDPGARAPTDRATGRLSQVLAREFAEFGVTVNVIRAREEADPGGSPGEGIGTAADWRRRVGGAVSEAVDLFLDPGSDALSGQILYVGVGADP